MMPGEAAMIRRSNAETNDETLTDGGLFPLKRNVYQGWMEQTGGR